MNLIVNSRLIIPSRELLWNFSRASGPGGQGVNTTDSRVELIFDIESSSVISPVQKQRLIDQLGKRLVHGRLRVVATEKRSQYQNRKIALGRLAEVLREGLQPPSKSRKRTIPTYSAQNRRIKNKKLRGELKQKRRIKPSIDD